MGDCCAQTAARAASAAPAGAAVVSTVDDCIDLDGFDLRQVSVMRRGNCVLCVLYVLSGVRARALCVCDSVTNARARRPTGCAPT
jgi:hypothetical protein